MTSKTPTTQQKTSPSELVIERVFNATPERLWSFWTDPKKYAKWLNPAPADLVIHEFDVRVGGKVRFDMPQPDGNKNPQEGVFHKLDPYRELVSGEPDGSFLLRVQFIPVNATQTRLVVTATGVPPEHHAMATVGWNGCLDKLTAQLSGSSAKGTGSSPPAAAATTSARRSTSGHVTKDRYVVVERWFAASPQKVFAAWGDEALLPKFFWPVGTGKVDKLDFSTGGELRMSHTSQPWTAIWTFVEIVPGKKIIVRDIWPDGSGLEATGTIEFIPENGGTRLKVRHGPFPTTGPYQPEGAVVGFGMVMDRLAETTEIPGQGEGFQIVRHFAVPPKKVWDMWTTTSGLDKWWKLAAQDMGYAFKVNKLDVRVGGAYDIQMSNKEHGELHNHGVYTEVTRMKRLAYRWDFDIFLAPGEKPYPISVAIDFEQTVTMDPNKPGTKMTFTQGPMAKPDFTEGSRQGVISNFAKLEKALDA